jgi:hypothetical protein
MATAAYTVQPTSATTQVGSSVQFSYTLTITDSIYNSPRTIWQVSNDGRNWLNLDPTKNDFGISTITPGVINGYI